MGDQQARGLLSPQQLGDLHAQGAAQLGVEGRERFVEEHEVGARSERPGECHPLRLTAGELRRGPVDERRQPDHGREVGDAPGPLTPGQAESDVLPDGQMRKQGGVLRNPADAALLRRQLQLRRGEQPITDPDGSR